MRLIQGMIVIMAVFGALAYSFNKKSVTAGELLPNQAEPLATLLLEDELALDSESAQLADMEIERATVYGDMLSAFVQYSACEDLSFDLLGARQFAESFPIQAQLQLRAEGAVDDDCAVVRSQEVQFDLSELREVFRNRYNMSSGTILIQLNDFPTLVRYDF